MDDDVSTLTTGAPPPGIVVAGDVINGRFRLIHEIGRGGMGWVFAAHDQTTGRGVAVKLLRPEISHEVGQVKRFQRESEVLSRIKSRHVVRIHEVGETNGAHYFVMDLLEGKDLDRLCRESAPMPWTRALSLIAQACDGLGQAHSLGIVHRDLKLSNLMLTTEHDEEIVSVLDFGLAKDVSAEQQPVATAATLTASGAIMGTPHYMAPEQFVGTMRIDTRTDVWAMGVCIYKLLTAKFPFDGSNLMRVCSRVLGKPPVPPRELVPDLPEAVDALVMRCLQREPDARFADGNELRAAIESLIPPAPDRDLDTARIDVAPPAAPAPGKPAPMPMLAQPTAAPVPAQPAAPAYRTDEPHSVPIRQAPEKARWPWWAPIALVAVLAVGGLLVFVLGWRAPSTTAAEGDRAPAPPTIDLPPPSVPTATPLTTATLAPSASASDTPPVAGSAPKASDASPKRAAPSRPLKGGRGTAPSATTTGDLYDKM